MDATTTEIYNALVREIEPLIAEHRVDDALARLDRATVEAQASTDTAGLKSALVSLRASVLCLDGRFAEALALWHERAVLGLRSSTDAYEVALGRSACFIGMGRIDDAIRILEVTLDRADPTHATSIRALLEKLFEAYVAVGKPFPARWRQTAARVKAAVPLRAEDHSPPNRLGAFVKRAAKGLETFE